MSILIKDLEKISDLDRANSGKPLLPIFKYTGGKRKEIKNFYQFLPNFVRNKEKYKYVEPFVGGGSVYFYLNNLNGTNVINDFEKDLSIFYKEYFLSSDKFINDIKNVAKIENRDILQGAYYSQRDLDKNNGLAELSDTKRAVRFFIVNQLSFSGMKRFNSKGEFNVPFGHYKKLSDKLINSDSHKLLLRNTKIFNGDFQDVIEDNDTDNSFCFLDPPYNRVFKKYSSNNSFDDKAHARLANVLKSLKHLRFLLIVNNSELFQNLYKDLIKSSYSVKYGVNIKNRFNSSVEHLIICNY